MKFFSIVPEGSIRIYVLKLQESSLRLETYDSMLPDYELSGSGSGCHMKFFFTADVQTDVRWLSVRVTIVTPALNRGWIQ